MAMMVKSKASQIILSTSRRGLDTFHMIVYPTDRKINFYSFFARRMIADILQEIQQYQNSRYCLKMEPLIQEFLKSHDVQGEMGHNQWEDHLFEQSLEIEPRDQPPKKVVSWARVLVIVASIKKHTTHLFQVERTQVWSPATQLSSWDFSPLVGCHNT